MKHIIYTAVHHGGCTPTVDTKGSEPNGASSICFPANSITPAQNLCSPVFMGPGFPI